MIQIFKISSHIEKLLQTHKNSNKIVDFRVVLRGNENLYAYIKGEENAEISDQIHNIYEDCQIEYIGEDLSENFYAEIFNEPNMLDIGPGRRRFDALLGAQNAKNLLNDSYCPIVTFYSYKGGMGRSTALAAFAMHLALNESLKVVVIDCDFEAPGFSNFFLRNPGEGKQQEGFVEYFFDRTTSRETAGESLEKYTWEVEKRYCGNGSIRIMPAGNLNATLPTDDFLKNHLNHYLEGLSRMDFLENYIVQEFKLLIESIQKAFNPDVILVDSRTGFNDVMGIMAFHLSKFVVGFFRDDAQTLPGLHFFLDTVIKREDIEPIIINSILPQSLTLRRIIHNRFKETVKTIVGNLSGDGDVEWDFPIYPIGRNENLEILGTSSEQTDDLIELIKTKDIRDYKDLFEFLGDRLQTVLSEKKKSKTTINTIEDGKTDISLNSFVVQEGSLSYGATNENLDTPPTLDNINKADENEKSAWMKQIKHKILNDVYKKLKITSLYAENQNVEKDFDENRFFFRVCMSDLFNLDKVIILGSKGTGKSYIYKALKTREIVEALKIRAEKTDDFVFFNMVDKTTRIIKVNGLEALNSRRYKDRFWLVYTWSVLMEEAAKEYPQYISAVKIRRPSISDTNTAKKEVEDIVKNDETISEIEKDMASFDAFLVAKGNGHKQYVTLIYDQLDEIVHPSLWSDWMPALIDFWRFKRYNRIFGKLFMRLDLFRQLIGITNINELENQAINFEWNPEEMFAYFFKVVLSNNMQDWFWAQMYLYQDFLPAFVKQVRAKYKKLDQISLEKYWLEPLSVTFFGKEVNVNYNTRMGSSYEWFYKNLQNADDTISLRPFIDLIGFAIEKAIDEDQQNNFKPILGPRFYTHKDIRKKAVERHFDDLQKNEIGNKPLGYIFDFLTNQHKFKTKTLRKDRFEEMLNLVLTQYRDKAEMRDQTIDTLEALLITNGIVKKNNHGRGDEFSFAFLYKYKLGLTGN